MSTFIEPSKGKDVIKVPVSRLHRSGWIPSVKYDGNYIQVHIDVHAKIVKFYTSGGERFHVPYYAREFIDMIVRFNDNRLTHDPFIDKIILETEWIGDTDGKLGSREKCQGIITTWRTEYAKGILSMPLITEGKFIIHDIINSDPYELRYKLVNRFADSVALAGSMCLDNFMSIDEVSEFSKLIRNMGYEGVYAKHRSHKHESGKRLNTAIKHKPRPTADLVCINTITAIEGKYAGKIGSLLVRDNVGRHVQVGSGLTDQLRYENNDFFIGKIIEVEYERFNETTYIQPVFIKIREDKTAPEDY